MTRIRRAFAATAIVLLFAGVAYGQQSDGSMELSVFGSATFPDQGGDSYLAFLQFGFYVKKWLQVGVGTTLDFTQGTNGASDSTTTNVTGVIEFDLSHSKVAPFISFAAGSSLVSSGGLTGSGSVVDGAVGLKFWLRDHAAFRIAFDRSQSDVTFNTSLGSFTTTTKQGMASIGITVLFGK